jgi:hypothetical protein
MINVPFFPYLCIPAIFVVQSLFISETIAYVGAVICTDIQFRVDLKAQMLRNRLAETGLHMNLNIFNISSLELSE